MADKLFTEIEQLIEQLDISIDNLVDIIGKKPVDNESDVQLKEISKTIERLESSGVSVPSILYEEKSRLITIVESNKSNQKQAINISNELNKLVLKLRNNALFSDKTKVENTVSRVTTPWRVIARYVITILRQHKREMGLNEILEEVYNELRYDLQPGDFKPVQHNGKPFWNNTVSRVLYNLRKESILKQIVSQGYYELEELYYENKTPYD